MRLSSLRLSDLKRLVHAQRGIAASHRLFLLLLRNLFQPFLRLHFPASFAVELVTQRLPSFLGRQHSPELVIINDVHIRSVILERIQTFSSILLFANAIFVLSRCLISVGPPRRQSF